ncbi:MAG: DUF6036 family nucleotidyltransferase [Limisphaerales bacterium]
MQQIDSSSLENALQLLGDLMATRKRSPLHLVVCGGAALIALNLVSRTTKDVDVLATMKDGRLHCARPLPDWLREDANAVRTELKLPDNWLNDGPADEDLFRLGLPSGVAERLVPREFGPVLKISFISRYDQIHLKLYAAADQGGRHLSDLRKLAPTAGELLAATRWTFTQDVSEGFRQMVDEVLKGIGHGNLTRQL